MLRRLFLLILLLFPLLAFASFPTPTDTCTGTTACNFAGSHKPGDLAIYFAWRAASTTSPSLPTGLTNVSTGNSATGASRSWRIACQIITTFGDTVNSGTFTNATNVAGITIPGGGIYGATCASSVTPLGTANSVSSATATFSALTLNSSSDEAVLLMGSNTSGNTCMPTGSTSRASTGDVNIGTANALGNWSLATCSITSSVTTEIVVGITSKPSVAACSTNCPTMVQWVHTASNAQNVTDTENPVRITLPNPTLSGNVLVLGVTYPHSAGRTVTPLTDNSDTFTAIKTFADGTNLIDSTVYCASATAGSKNVTVTFDTALNNLQFSVAEFAHATCTTDGTATGSSTVAPAMTPGAITTTVADDLIFQYGIDVHGSGVGAGNLMTGCFTQFNLMGCERRFPSFSQYYVAHAIGSTTPNLVFTGAADEFNDVAIALKNSANGTLPSAGIHIDGVLHTQSNFNSNATDFVYFPCAGNLIVGMTSFSTTTNQTLSISGDSTGNTWTSDIISTTLPQAFHAGGATCTNQNVISVGASPTGLFQLVFYAISGANSSPFVAKGSNTGSCAATCTAITGGPTWSPAAANNLGLVVNGFGTGPASALTNPTGGIFDSLWGTGMSDSSTFDNGDGYAHLYTTGTSAISFDWTMSNGGAATAWNAVYLEFKPPAGAAAPANQYPRVISFLPLPENVSAR